MGKKALCFPRNNGAPKELEDTIWIDRKFWLNLRNEPARLFIYFHECGHLEGARCEPCADMRAGEWLKWWGIGVPRDAQIAALNTLQNRSGLLAQANIAEGFGEFAMQADASITPAPWFPASSRGLEHPERAIGVVSNLLNFATGRVASEMNRRGVRVVVGLDGGVRTDAAKQQSYCQSGASNACTLADTPHGHAGAIDLVLCDPTGSALPDSHPAWAYLAEMATDFGFKSGASWGDLDHVEVVGWRNLPMPSSNSAPKSGPGTALAGGAGIVLAIGIALALKK